MHWDFETLAPIKTKFEIEIITEQSQIESKAILKQKPARAGKKTEKKAEQNRDA